MRNKGQWLVAASLGIVIVGAAGAWQMLRGDRRPERPSVTVPELSALAREGAASFARSCAACHGPAGGGTSVGPPLVHEVYRKAMHADIAFELAVRRGVRAHHWRFGDMPAAPSVLPLRSPADRAIRPRAPACKWYRLRTRGRATEPPAVGSHEAARLRGACHEPAQSDGRATRIQWDSFRTLVFRCPSQETGARSVACRHMRSWRKRRPPARLPSPRLLTASVMPVVMPASACNTAKTGLTPAN